MPLRDFTLDVALTVGGGCLALAGPSGAGKTTLTEALLTASGVVNRAGSVTEGTTVCDHDPAAVRQQRSVGLAVAPLTHDGIKVNLIDTPGYADFVGELRAGLRAADAALFVVSASEGVDAATVALWEECSAVGMPTAAHSSHSATVAGSTPSKADTTNSAASAARRPARSSPTKSA